MDPEEKSVAQRVARDEAEAEGRLAPLHRLFEREIDRPPVRGAQRVYRVFSGAGGSLLAEGLAYSALFAGMTGLLFAVGVLGYLVPAAADRQAVVDRLTGQLAPLSQFARSGLDSVAANAGAFSIVGLAGMAWGASHFYGALDTAIGRVFARTPARGAFDKLLRGIVSVLLLVGGLLSGIAVSAIQAVVTSNLTLSGAGVPGQVLPEIAFPIVTAILVVASVGVVYRVVPNTHVPFTVLALPALAAGLALTALTELLVYIAPLLTGALALFGGVAAVFATLAWLHLGFQVLLLGAAWTRLRLEDAEGTRAETVQAGGWRGTTEAIPRTGPTTRPPAATGRRSAP